MKRLTVAAALTASWPTAVISQPQTPPQPPSRVHMLSGAYDVSGAGNCAVIDGTHYILSFHRTFETPPTVAVETTVTDAHDSLEAHVLSVARDHAEVVATGSGVNGHQICAKATIHWTASE